MEISAFVFFMFFAIVILSIAQIIFMSIETVKYDSLFLSINITNDKNDENDENENFIMNNN